MKNHPLVVVKAGMLLKGGELKIGTRICADPCGSANLHGFFYFKIRENPRCEASVSSAFHSIVN